MIKLKKKVLENITKNKIFRIQDAYEYILNEIQEKNLDIKKQFLKIVSEKRFKEIVKNLIRNIFYIEAVNRDITSTKFTYRWLPINDKFSNFSCEDSRGCTYEECLKIFEKLLNNLLIKLNDKKYLNILNLFMENSILPYEIPLDYKNTSKDKIHTDDNIIWVDDPIIENITKLRMSFKQLDYEFNVDENGIKKERIGNILNKILSDKIKIKTYLTDRAQTGKYQTNREKRWEAHPDSPQFSSRTDSLKIEYTLLVDLIYFENFPEKIKSELVNLKIIPSKKNEFTKCPITLEKLNFKTMVYATYFPVHGKAEYQVGHLDPLKGDVNKHGHKHTNIGWTSRDGNRIQGHLSLEDTQSLLKKIFLNYNLKN